MASFWQRFLQGCCLSDAYLTGSSIPHEGSSSSSMKLNTSIYQQCPNRYCPCSFETYGVLNAKTSYFIIYAFQCLPGLGTSGSPNADSPAHESDEYGNRAISQTQRRDFHPGRHRRTPLRNPSRCRIRWTTRICHEAGGRGRRSGSSRNGLLLSGCHGCRSRSRARYPFGGNCVSEGHCPLVAAAGFSKADLHHRSRPFIPDGESSSARILRRNARTNRSSRIDGLSSPASRDDACWGCRIWTTESRSTECRFGIQQVNVWRLRDRRKA